MRRLIRWTSLAALTVLVLPILHEFAIQHQLYDIPTGSVSTASCWIPKPSPCPIAKLAQWTAPLRYFPTRSVIKTWANTVRTRPTFLATDACFWWLRPELRRSYSDKHRDWRRLGPLLALSGHPICTDGCPLSGVKRT